MVLEKLCPPALLYVGFSLTQIIIDIFKNMYNTAFFKLIVMVIFTIVLNILCERGLGIISWFIVFVPFIMMSVITTLLLFVFGLSPSAGKLNYNVEYPGDNTKTTSTPTSKPTSTPTSTPTSVVKSVNDADSDSDDDDIANTNNVSAEPKGTTTTTHRKIKIITPLKI